jgi:hypothetical protein
MWGFFVMGFFNFEFYEAMFVAIDIFSDHYSVIFKRPDSYRGLVCCEN